MGVRISCISRTESPISVLRFLPFFPQQRILSRRFTMKDPIDNKLTLDDLHFQTNSTNCFYKRAMNRPKNFQF